MSIPKQEISFTHKQGQYLAYIYYYTKINKVPPAQRDIQDFFDVTPPTVHQMIIQLDKNNLIKRQPNTARSLAINIPESMIPRLL